MCLMIRELSSIQPQWDHRESFERPEYLQENKMKMLLKIFNMKNLTRKINGESINMNKKPSFRKILFCVTFAVILIPVTMYASDISKPYTFSTGNIVSSSQFNANFDALFDTAWSPVVAHDGPNTGDIYYNGGKVGIGTIPAEKLDVEGNIATGIGYHTYVGKTGNNVGLYTDDGWMISSLDLGNEIYSYANGTINANHYGQATIGGNAPGIETMIGSVLTVQGDATGNPPDNAQFIITDEDQQHRLSFMMDHGLNIAKIQAEEYMAGWSILSLQPGGGSVSISTTVNNGGLTIGGSVYPAVDNISNLGAATYRFKTIYATNGTIQTSDIRQKTNIELLPYGLKEILNLTPISFAWKNSPDKSSKLGLIGQEVMEQIPEAASVGSDEEHTIGLYYSDLIPVMIKAIQEQQEIFEKQKQEIESALESKDKSIVELKDENIKLKQKIQNYENRISKIEEKLKGLDF